MNAQPAPKPVASLLAAAALIAALGASCAGPKQAEPAGAGSAPAPAAKAALPQLTAAQPPAGMGAAERSAWQTVNQMGEAFSRGDVPAFLEKVSNGFYGGYGNLETALLELVGTTAMRNLVVAVQEVQVDGEVFSVRAKWTRSLLYKDRTRAEGFGETVFLLRRKDGEMRLIKYQGDPIFGLEGI
jgi:hypothetical protein